MRCLLRDTSIVTTPEAGKRLPLTTVLPWALISPLVLSCSPRVLTEEILSCADQISRADVDSRSLALCSEVNQSLFSVVVCLSTYFRTSSVRAPSKNFGHSERSPEARRFVVLHSKTL